MKKSERVALQVENCERVVILKEKSERVALQVENCERVVVNRKKDHVLRAPLYICHML